MKNWIKKIVAGIVMAVLLIEGFATGLCEAYAKDGYNVALDEENFPDEEFRNFLKTADSNQDGFLSSEEVENNWECSLKLSGVGVKSIKGIEKLTNLKSVYIQDTLIECLDFSEYTSASLLTLVVSDKRNRLVKIDLGQDNGIKNVKFCDVKNLKEIVWHKGLIYAEIELNNTDYTDLDLSVLGWVEDLILINTKISSLDFTNKDLYGIAIENSPIEKLDVSHMTDYFCYAYLSGCHLSEIDFSNNRLVSELPNWDRPQSVLNYGLDSEQYAPQQIYLPLKKNASGGYSVTVDGVTDSSRMKNVTSGYAREEGFTGDLESRRNGKTVTWDKLSQVPSNISYQYDTKAPLEPDYFLDVNVNIIKPAVITNVKQGENFAVTLTWKPEVPNEDKERPVSYEVYRSNSKNGTYQKIGTTGKTAFTDNNISSGKTYYYKLKTVTETYKGTISSEPGEAVSIKTEGPDRAVIKTIQSPSANRVKLAWNRANGAKTYKIYRSEHKTKGYKLIGRTEKLGYTDKVTCGKTYYYKIVSAAALGKSEIEGGASNIKGIKVKPEGVPKISAVKRTAYNKLQIRWNKAAGATGYRVYRSTKKNGTYKKVGTVTGTSYTDSVKTGTVYYYKILSYAKCGGKNIYAPKYSPVKSGKASLSKAALSGVKKSGTAGAIIKWKKVKGATGYSIYRSNRKSGGYKRRATVKSLSYTDKKLTKGKTYYYKIRAYRTVNGKKIYGSYSNVKKIKR